MDGREKCELLNNIRQKIAEKNDIEFTIYDCTFEGECSGTCPKCESEIRYLEKELEKKQARGEEINIIGIFDEKPEICANTDYNPFDHGQRLQGDIMPMKKDLEYPFERELGDIMPPEEIKRRKYGQ